MDRISSHQNLKLRNLIVLQRGCQLAAAGTGMTDLVFMHWAVYEQCATVWNLMAFDISTLCGDKSKIPEWFGQTLHLSVVLGATQSQHLVLASMVGIPNMFSLHQYHTGKALLDEPDAENEQFLSDFPDNTVCYLFGHSVS